MKREPDRAPIRQKKVWRGGMIATEAATGRTGYAKPHCGHFLYPAPHRTTLTPPPPLIQATKAIFDWRKINFKLYQHFCRPNIKISGNLKLNGSSITGF